MTVDIPTKWKRQDEQPVSDWREQRSAGRCTASDQSLGSDHSLLAVRRRRL